MNELQIRLKADIQQFQAAMSTVETKLKSAEGILKKASTTADKYRGSLANLSAQFKKGAISQSDYDKQATKLSNGLLKQQDIINNSTREINRLNNEYKRLNTAPLIASQSRLAASTNNLGGSVAGLTGNVRGANSVAIEFNRIVQDAPFGIIGVGNNIQQLAGNFSNLARNAGGTIPAIKAAFSALATGPNLALLAISALTAGFTAYQMGLFGSKKKTKDLADEIERLKEASDNYLKTLTDVGRATIKGNQNAQTELAVLNRLFKATTDTTLTIEQRKKAVDTLQATYPNVFGNIKEETILNGEAKKSYEELSEAILANARAKAAESTLIENEKRLIQLAAEREEVNQRILDGEALIDEKKKDQVIAAGQLKSFGQQIADSEKRILEPIYVRRAELNKEINKLTIQNGELTKKVNVEVAKTGNLLDNNVDSASDLVGETDKVLDVFTDERWQQGQDFLLEYGRALDEVVKKFPDIGDVVASGIDSLGAPIKETFEIDDEKLNQFLIRLEQFNQQVSSVLENGAEQSLGDFAFAIGEAIGNGTNVLESSGAALLNGLANIMNQLGQLAIGTGIAIAGIKKALQTLNPAVAIGAGVALIALAGFVSSKARSLGNFSGAGSNAGLSATQGTTFTNAGSPVGATSIPFPVSNNVGTTGISNEGARMEIDVNITGFARGEDILFVTERAAENRRNR